MNRQVRLFVCLAALCVCAIARPGDNDVKPVKKHEIIKMTCTHFGLLFTPDPSIKFPDDHDKGVNEEHSDPVATKDQEKTKPVNERYPHAVLFGGTCGGTIISPTWILTASHCTLFTGGKFVLAGTNNSEDGTGITRHVKRLVVHPRFSVGPYWLNAKRFNISQVAARFDFLLAELDEPLPLDGKTMVAAKLNDVSRLIPKTNVGYAGYGAEHHGETMRHNMHAMELSILSEEECAELEEYDAEDMICARGRPPRFDSACNGDSGSGLVDENGVLVGIASWVEKDATECRNGNIVYFSKVSTAREWIRKVAKV